uniref:sphingosine kinase n=1 Tax=Latimeria chalumnae TaxID=7897 RepID=H3AJD1_LATCH
YKIKLSYCIFFSPDITPGLLPRPRRLLLLVNPYGGRGQAMHYCQTCILPMISEADITYNLIKTERQNHARELVRDIILSEWDGIVIISGDGLLYEVINGLMERPDWEKAIKIPVGILPCGSGNALAGAVNFHAGFDQVVGEELLLNCTFLLCRSSVSPMDLVSVTTASGHRFFSFLGVAWGFVSDVDIESERFRHMGPARFTLGVALRLASLRTYRGRLSYLPAEDGGGRRAMSRSITLAPTNGGRGFHRSPLHRTVSDMGLCEERSVLFKRSSALVEPSDFEASPSPFSPASNFSFEAVLEESAPPPLLTSLQREAETNGQPKQLAVSESHHLVEVQGPPDDLLPAFDEPVPHNWVTIEADFVLVLAIYQTHLGADLLSAPFARFDDGLIHLCCVRAGISRASLVRVLLAMEKGTHFELDCPHLTYVPVRAFRLTPLTTKGILTVDGERVEYGPLQAQAHPHLASLITGKSKVKITPL